MVFVTRFRYVAIVRGPGTLLNNSGWVPVGDGGNSIHQHFRKPQQLPRANKGEEKTHKGEKEREKQKIEI